MELPLKNNKKEIIDYTIVSEEDFEKLSKFKWYKNNNGYVVSTINGKTCRMHRYIMIEILGNELTSKQPIDHINNNKLDNTRDNLRVSTNSENSQNKKKIKNTSSIYKNVFYIKKTKKWRAQITIPINSKKISAIYNREIEAAWQVNIWIDEFNLKFAIKNDIQEPDNFIMYKSKQKKEDYPKGISKIGNTLKLQVQVKSIYYGTFNKLEDAIIMLEKVKIKNYEDAKNKILSTPILYNKNNQCIFKVKENEVIVDEDLYYDIIKYTWYNNNGYIRGTINGKNIHLNRYIMKYTGDNVVDYIDGNKLNNTRSNLRVATYAQSGMNKTFNKNSSSQFIGVSFIKATGKWTSRLYIEGKCKHLGTFTNELDAAKVRDEATKKYFGAYGKLNFPEV